jgi:hypothetical protein
MSGAVPSRPKRLHKMSKKQKHIMGLPSDSDADPSSHSDSDSEESEEDGVPLTANTSRLSPPSLAPPCSRSTTAAPDLLSPSVLHHSQSTISIASQSSVPDGGSAKADESGEKYSKFDERFHTATSTDEEVLGVLSFSPISLF